MRWLLSSIGLILALAAPAGAKVRFEGFDLQGHRGARDERPENTLAGFSHALEVGVSTLELDLQITRDGQVVVSHNPHLEPALAKDAAGRWVEGARKPLIRDLTLAELGAYDVGTVNPLDPVYWMAHGRLQTAAPGERIPTLDQVFDLAARYGNATVRFNIETKIDPTHPTNAPDPYTFARLVVDVVKRRHLEDRVMVQSFDWRTLAEVRRLDKGITLVALTCELPSGTMREVGKPGCSPWLAGLDIDDFGGSSAKAAKAINADVLSPCYLEVDKAMVDNAHQLGLEVVPWTVNEAGDANRLIDLGVDGLITDRPTAMRRLLESRGIPVPLPSKLG